MITGDEKFQERLNKALTGLRSDDLITVRKAREARDNTRIEELAEAFENLACAVSALAMSKVDRNRGTHPMVTQYLADSRTWLRDAVRGFMSPNLSLVEGVRQIDASVPEAERIRCSRCKNTSCCRDLMCPDWHAAVHNHIQGEPALPPDDDQPRVA